MVWFSKLFVFGYVCSPPHVSALLRVQSTKTTMKSMEYHRNMITTVPPTILLILRTEIIRWAAAAAFGK